MPAPFNRQHETFAQARAKGATLDDAAPAASSNAWQALTPESCRGAPDGCGVGAIRLQADARKLPIGCRENARLWSGDSENIIEINMKDIPELCSR